MATRHAGHLERAQNPEDVSEKLLLLVRTLGLHYGCIDLRQRPDGTYVFPK